MARMVRALFWSSGVTNTMTNSKFKFPLMKNNISREDLDSLIDYLQGDDPQLTHGPLVRDFEKKWADWVGTKYAVCVNSGSSANDLTMLALRHFAGDGEVIVPPLTWVSDIASILHARLTPIFVDINLRTLGLDEELILANITSKTKAVFLTHILGINGLSQKLLRELNSRNILLIEDVCESHGGTLDGKRLGSFGWASNFSFYYAHHLTTIEGGAVCTNDYDLYQFLRSARSHGLAREIDDNEMRNQILSRNPELNSDFIFQFPAHNMRPTEFMGILGTSQLARLEKNIEKRNSNFHLFNSTLDTSYFFTGFNTLGISSYALIGMLANPNLELRNNMESAMNSYGLEFRRGLSGGGNQLRQPYLSTFFRNIDLANFPNVEHVHSYSWYFGNYPDLSPTEVQNIAIFLNNIAKQYS